MVIIWDKDGPSTSVTLVTRHIITDKASLGLILRSVSSLYQQSIGLTNGHHHYHSESTEARAPNYVDWARWLKSKQNTVSAEKRKRQQFWKDHLYVMQHIEALYKSQVPGEQLGSFQSILIPPPTPAHGYGDKFAFSQRLAVAAVALSLRAVFGSIDMTLGLPYMNRDEHGTENMIGLLLDRIPIRLKLNNQKLCGDSDIFLDEITRQINTLVEFQLPWTEIQSLAGQRSLTEVMITYHWHSDRLEDMFALQGSKSSSSSIRARGAKFPLLYEFTETIDGGLLCVIEYNSRLVSPDQLAMIMHILPAAIDGLAQKVSPEAILEAVASTTATTSFTILNQEYRRRVDIVLQAFSEILQVDPSGIDNSTSFLDLGASSVLVLRLHWLLRSKYGLTGEVRDILYCPTPLAIAWRFYDDV